MDMNVHVNVASAYRSASEARTHWRPPRGPLWDAFGRFCIFKSTTKYKQKHSSTSWSRLGN